MPDAMLDALVAKLNPGRFPARPLVESILGYLLGQSWGRPPIRCLEIRPDGKVVADGVVVCSRDDMEVAINLICDEAGLTVEECDRLCALMSARHWFAPKVAGFNRA